MKIENKPVVAQYRAHNADGKERFQDFVATLIKLKPGQSFLVQDLPSHYRVAISVTQQVRGMRIASARDGEGFRVGAVK